MSFAGLSATQMLTLFGSLASGMLLLYLLKLRRRRVRVPFGPLWSRVVEEKRSSTLFSSLKRLFSFLTQLVILACVVLALGDPQLGGFAGCVAEKAPELPERHTLIILDASASMGARPSERKRLEKARDEARKVIDNIVTNPNHRAMVVQLDQKISPLSLWTNDSKALYVALDAYAPNGAVDTPTGAHEALEQLRSMVQGRPNAQTILISDQAFPALPEEDVTSLNLRTINVGGVGTNIGIETFNVRPSIDDSLSYAIFFGIRNEGDKPLKAMLTLYANEDGLGSNDFIQDQYLISSHPLELAPNARTTGLLHEVHFPGSRVLALIELDEADENDVLASDNIAFALVPERKKLNVQLVSPGNLFLHASLFVRENIEFQEVDVEDFQGAGDYDVTIVDSLDVDMSNPGTYFVLNPQPGGPFDVKGVLEEPELGALKKGHPLLHRLNLVDLNILEASRIDTQKGDVVVAATRDGQPLIFTRNDTVTDRRFVVFTFDIRKSLLPFNYAFPLLVVNVFNHFFKEDAALLKPARAGIELSIPSALEGSQVNVRGPADANQVLARRIGSRVHLFTDRIGIYELTSAESDTVQTLAINLMSPEESNIATMGMYPAWTPDEVLEPVESPWLEEFWRILILAALFFFSVEWFTYHRRITV
jgi:hypothetical protein